MNLLKKLLGVKIDVYISFILFLFIVTSIFCFSVFAENNGTVIQVIDGDTIRVLMNGKKIKIRLYGIDCPELKKKSDEKSQPYGAAAKDFTASLCLNKKVRIVPMGESFDRMVGVVHLPDGKVLNKEILSNGYAWWDYIHCQDEEWGKLEAKARIKRLGLWKDAFPVPPWVVRHKDLLLKENKL
jgi:micrococcal nuclease